MNQNEKPQNREIAEQGRTNQLSKDYSYAIERSTRNAYGNHQSAYAPQKLLTLAGRTILNIAEAAQFLTEECDHKTFVPTLYTQIL